MYIERWLSWLNGHPEKITLIQAILTRKNLGAAIYEEAAYDASIDDRQLPLPPTRSQVARQWLDGLLTPIRGLG